MNRDVLSRRLVRKGFDDIALSAHAMAGCNEFDTKPIDFAGLVTQMSLLLEAAP